MRASLSASPRVAASAAPTPSSSSSSALRTAAPAVVVAPLPRSLAAAPLPISSRRSLATRASPSTDSAAAPVKPPPPSAKSPRMAEPADPEAAWAKARDLQSEGTPVSVVVTAVNKGGVVVALPVGEGVEGAKAAEGGGGEAGAPSSSSSLRGFIPTSKLDPSRVPAGGPPPRSLVGTAIDAKVVQVDAAGRKLILSERAASLASLAGAIAAGDVLTGVVTRLCDYGAFVSLQSPGDGGLHGAEGLIHLSELSWDAVLTPEAVVQPGTVVRVRVLGADAERGRIRLSLKRMEADPLTETLDALLPLGEGGDSSSAERVAAASASTSASAASTSGGGSSDASPALVPTSIEGVCDALRAEPGVDSVKLGRQAEEKRAVSQDLELWISRAVVADGYALVARSGRLAQEIHVTTSLPRDAMKQAVTRVLSKLV